MHFIAAPYIEISWLNVVEILICEILNLRKVVQGPYTPISLEKATVVIYENVVMHCRISLRTHFWPVRRLHYIALLQSTRAKDNCEMMIIWRCHFLALS